MIKFNSDTPYLLLIVIVYGLSVLPLTFELPAISLISSTFNLNNAEMKFSITLFWATFTFGQFLFAYLLPRVAVQKLISIFILIYILCFALHACIYSKIIFLLLRLIEGTCCGALLIMGRFSMAKKYGSNEAQYLSQFAKLSSSLTALTVMLPIVGAFISDYLNWRYIYLLIALSAICLLNFKTRAFIFRRPDMTTIKHDFMIVLGDVNLLCKSILGGFARSILLNFNTNLALYLLSYRHWSSIHYGGLMLFFSFLSMGSRLYLSKMISFFGLTKLNYILMSIIVFSALSLLFKNSYKYEMLFYISGALITVSSSLLATVYSFSSQYRLADQKQAMSLAVMGVIQNVALVAGTFINVFLTNDSLFQIMELIILSTCILFIIDYASKIQYKKFESLHE